LSLILPGLWWRKRRSIDTLYPNDYISTMYTIKTINEFEKWLSGIRDRTARIRLARQIDRLQKGQFGDVKHLAEGVLELREHFGPGWRMYGFNKGEVIIIMLSGGDKSSQSADIAKALQKTAGVEE
jgi:putative addiction module killer protein